MRRGQAVGALTIAAILQLSAIGPAGPKHGRAAGRRAAIEAALAGWRRTASLGPFTLENGTTLPELTVSYRHDGPPPGEAPQVLVAHMLTGSADAAGEWWAPLIGDGSALDTTRLGVLCANLLGSRYGTTGPTSLDPKTGRPYGDAFPIVSVADQARAQWALLDHLGIDELALVVGGSLGGMVALEVGLSRPHAVRRVAPIAAPASIGSMATAWNHVQLQLIELVGVRGLSLARQLAMTTYRTEIDYERFNGSLESDGRPSVVSYLEYQGSQLVDRFDPTTYKVMVAAMDSHDIGRNRGGVDAALRRLAEGGVALTGIGIQDDLLYGPRQVRALVDAAAAAGVRAVYREIASTHGHDAFMLEWDQLSDLLREALTA